MTRLICWLIGHRPFVHDVLPDGTKVRGCTRCGTYVVRDAADPRPHAPNMDPRFHIPRGEQARARWTAVSRLRRTEKSDNAAVVKAKLRSAS